MSLLCIDDLRGRFRGKLETMEPVNSIIEARHQYVALFDKKDSCRYHGVLEAMCHTSERVPTEFAFMVRIFTRDKRSCVKCYTSKDCFLYLGHVSFNAVMAYMRHGNLQLACMEEEVFCEQQDRWINHENVGEGNCFVLSAIAKQANLSDYQMQKLLGEIGTMFDNLSDKLKLAEDSFASIPQWKNISCIDTPHPVHYMEYIRVISKRSDKLAKKKEPTAFEVIESNAVAWRALI